MHTLYNTKIQLSNMAAHTNTQPGSSMVSDMLDLSFVTEWSDDEGIGSDVSLENSEQSSSSGTLNNTDTLRRQARQLVKIPKRNISVKKFVKIFRRNSEAVSTEVPGPVSGSQESQFQSQRVFGVDLTEHLEQTSCLVPRIVEFCCDIIQEHGLTDGVYRLSGQSSHIVTLKREFEGGKVPELESRSRDVHAVASLLKVSKIITFLDDAEEFYNSSSDLLHISFARKCNMTTLTFRSNQCKS